MYLPKKMENPIDTEDLIKGFYQGRAGNCASIAPIKAALMLFGKNSIFRSVDIREDEYVVVMRDSKIEYTFTDMELDRATKLSNFKGDDLDLLEYAHFIFAAMCKRAQLENNDNHAEEGFDSAISSLNDGEYWKDGPFRLGLGDYVISGPDSRLPLWNRGRLNAHLRQHRVSIVKSAKHVWFSSEGMHDWYGSVKRSLPRFSSGVISMKLPENFEY